MRSWLRRSLTLLLALSATAAGGGLIAVAARAYVFRLTVTAAKVGRAIPQNFLGLALEYNTIPQLLGPRGAPVNPVFAQLLRNLDPTGRPLIRVGGQSTDRAWWPVPGMRRPLGVTYNLTNQWTAAARRLAQATHSRLLLGINLEANRTRIAQMEGSHLLSGIGRANIDGLEVGNEPDLYPIFPWYRVLGGRPIAWYSKTGAPRYSRRASYGPSAFLQEFSRIVRVLPRLPLAGPETGSPPWMSAFSGYLSPGSQLRMLTSHAYGLNQCVTDPAAPQYPSVPHLLSVGASRSLISGSGPFIAATHRDGATYRVDEMGSVSCNGRAGVSNTLASALWLMDSLFDVAASGVDGVNLHSYPKSANGLFDFSTVKGVDEGDVHPLYYGALMFAQAAPAGARRLAISAANQTNLRAWATTAPDRRTRVLLINDNLRSSADVVVADARGGAPAAVERLSASSAYATSGITLGGVSFGARTQTGVLPAPVQKSVPDHGGSYSVTVAPGSAALVTIPPSG